MNGYELAEPPAAAAWPATQAAAGRHDRLRPGRGPPRARKQAGFDHHLVKPVSFQKLQEVLNSWEAPKSLPCPTAENTALP